MNPLFARIALVLVLLLATTACADGPKLPSAEEKALRQRAEKFVEAFNKGDVDALVEFWAEDADYIDQVGRLRKGKKAIGDAYKKLFAGKKGPKLAITILSVRV